MLLTPRLTQSRSASLACRLAQTCGLFFPTHERSRPRFAHPKAVREQETEPETLVTGQVP